MSVPALVVAPTAELAARFASLVEAAARSAVRSRGHFTWALPGGSAAEALLPALCAADVDWSRVETFWGDERAVAAAHPDSNARLARRLLLDHVPVRPQRVHPLRGDAADPAAEARRYAALLRRLVGEPPRLDLVLLGVGEDGHVGSLFPGHAALAERRRLVVAIDGAPKPPSRRYTLTLPVLRAARLVCVAAFGAAKAAVLRRALEARDAALPLARVLAAAPRVHVLLDAAAASALSRRRLRAPEARG